MLIKTKYLIVLVVVVRTVSSHKCVTYDFEENLDENMNSCAHHIHWNLRSYDSADIDAPHPSSTHCVESTTQNLSDGIISCMRSHELVISQKGVLEVMLYKVGEVHLNVNIYADIGQSLYSLGGVHVDSISQDGWHIQRATNFYIPGGPENPYAPNCLAYIYFWGVQAEGSILLLDSFRYIPPEHIEEECLIYNDTLKPSTIPPTEPATEPTTEPSKEPTEPTKPTQPTEPTEPIQPTEPIEPTPTKSTETTERPIATTTKPPTDPKNIWKILTISLIALGFLIIIICCVGLCCYKCGKSSTGSPMIKIINNNGSK